MLRSGKSRASWAVRHGEVPWVSQTWQNMSHARQSLLQVLALTPNTTASSTVWLARVSSARDPRSCMSGSPPEDMARTRASAYWRLAAVSARWASCSRRGTSRRARPPGEVRRARKLGAERRGNAGRPVGGGWGKAGVWPAAAATEVGGGTAKEEPEGEESPRRRPISCLGERGAAA